MLLKLFHHKYALKWLNFFKYGTREWLRAASGKVQTGYWEKVLYWEGGEALEQAPRGSGHGPKPGRVQEGFGQHPSMYGLAFRSACVESGIGL